MTTIEYKKLASNTIANLSFPLTIYVVLEHCFITNSGNSIVDAIFQILGYPSISSVFFVISGYLFFQNISKYDFNTYKNKLGNRFKSLLIPYFIANTFMILCYGLMHYFTPHFINPDNFNVLKFSFKEFIFAYYDAAGGFPICYPLWYIRNLYIIVIISPLLYLILKQPIIVKIIGGITIGAIYCLFDFTFFIGVFYFYLGALLSQNDIESFIIKYYKRFKYGIFIILAIFLITIYLNYINYHLEICESIMRFSGVILTIILAFHLSKRGRLKGVIFHSSFFIYLYHAFLVFVLRELLIMVINPTSTIMWIITYILLVLTTIFILVSAFIILKKYLPSFTAIITGGRSNKK